MSEILAASARCVAASAAVSQACSVSANPDDTDLMEMAEALAQLAAANGVDIGRCIHTAVRRQRLDDEIFGVTGTGKPHTADPSSQSASGSGGYPTMLRTPAWASPLPPYMAGPQGEQHQRLYGLEILREATISRTTQSTGR